MALACLTPWSDTPSQDLRINPYSLIWLINYSVTGPLLPTFSSTLQAQPTELLRTSQLQFVLYRMVVWISNQPPQGPSCFVSSIVKGAQCLAGYVTEVLFLLMSAFLTFQSKSPSPSNWEMFCHLHDCQVGHAFSHICISSQYEECEVQGQAEKLPLYRSCKYNLCSSLFSDLWRPVLIRAVTPLCEAVRAWERELYLPLKAWNSLDS